MLRNWGSSCSRFATSSEERPEAAARTHQAPTDVPRRQPIQRWSGGGQRNTIPTTTVQWSDPAADRTELPASSSDASNKKVFNGGGYPPRSPSSTGRPAPIHISGGKSNGERLSRGAAGFEHGLATL